MRIICSKDKLMENINIVLKTVSSKSPMKTLECILLKVTAESFVMITNDMEMGIETSPIEAEIEYIGNVALEAKLFSDIVRKMPSGDITIDCDQNFVTVISNGKVKFKILGIDGDEFPTLPFYEKSNFISINAAAFKDMIKKTIFSVATDSAKPVFKGELFEAEDGFLNMVSVDGFRISFARSEISGADSAVEIVPGKALSELVKILPDDKENEVKMYFSENQIIFELSDFIFVSRLLNGDFLRYKQSFVDDYATKATVNISEFLMSLERTILISSDAKKHPVYLKFESNIMFVTTQTEAGTFNDEIEVELEGAPIEIAFNPRYLIDALKAADNEEIEMYFSTPLSACIMKSSENTNYKFLVLPLRTKY